MSAFNRLKFKIQDRVNHIIERPILTTSLVLLFVSILVISLSLEYYISGFGNFWPQILVEAHAMKFDITIIGILIFRLNQNGEIRQPLEQIKISVPELVGA